MFKKRSLATLLALILVFSLAIVPVSAAPGEDHADAPLFTILHTNDVHGNFAASSSIIGHDVVAAIFKAAAADGPTFLLDAGDAIQGVFFVGQSKGEAAIDIMNAAGYDAMVMGNHEFDYGWERAVELIGMANFPVLSQINEDVENLKHYTIIERDGVKLGVFGLTTPETQFKSGGGFERDFGTKDDLIADAKADVEALKAEGADYIVCLTHLGIEDIGYGTSYDIRDSVEGIDLIIDGHSHSTLDKIVQADDKAPIVSTGTATANLGKVEVYADHVDYVSIAKADTADITPDADVTAVITKWGDAVKAEGAVVVAKVPEDITVARANERTRETVMGNIITDAMRAASGADIAIENGGGIRDQKLTAGDVTKEQLVTILPFGNVLQMAEVTGAQLKEVLEVGVSSYPAANGGFVHISGASYTFNPAAPKGSRVTSITVDGKAIDMNKKYKLASNDFSATGGDNWTALKAPFQTQLPLKEAELSALEQVLIWYLNQDDFAMPEVGGRITAEWAFADLEGEDAEIVIELAAAGILTGFPDGNFYGDLEITRAQLATILTRALGLKAPEEGVALGDVTGKEWYASSVQAVIAAGYMKANDAGMFLANDPVLFGQLGETLTAAFEHDHEVLEDTPVTRIELALALYECLNAVADAA